MTLFDAIILGFVEGLTEFLPVSSTGHLILAKMLLGLDDSVDAYLVGIQLGALVSVLIYYRTRVAGMIRGIAGGDAAGRALALNLVVAFLPAAVLGLLFHRRIEDLLFSPVTVALALIVGGIAMVVVEKTMHPERARTTAMESVSVRDAALVGLAQCLSLWPGMSRSMATIVGAQLRGFSNQLAADFSFLLALPTLGAATIYTLANNSVLLTGGNTAPVFAGLATAFVVAWIAIAGFLRILNRVGMAPFGYYRVVLGVIVLGLAVFGKLN